MFIKTNVRITRKSKDCEETSKYEPAVINTNNVLTVFNGDMEGILYVKTVDKEMLLVRDRMETFLK